MPDNHVQFPVILASQSPRRRQLLEQAELKFTIQSADIAEDFPADMPPAEAPVFIASNKAEAIAQQHPDSIVIAADTVVILEGEIIGKPVDRADALRMLQSLSGKKHEVVTGVVIQQGRRKIRFSETTTVFFRPLTAEQIIHYLDHYKPYDKAGSYAIQEWIGLTGIEKIQGDYYNVMGLPVCKVMEALREML